MPVEGRALQVVGEALLRELFRGRARGDRVADGDVLAAVLVARPVVVVRIRGPGRRRDHDRVVVVLVRQLDGWDRYVGAVTAYGRGHMEQVLAALGAGGRARGPRPHPHDRLRPVELRRRVGAGPHREPPAHARGCVLRWLVRLPGRARVEDDGRGRLLGGLQPAALAAAGAGRRQVNPDLLGADAVALPEGAAVAVARPAHQVEAVVEDGGVLVRVAPGPRRRVRPVRDPDQPALEVELDQRPALDVDVREQGGLHQLPGLRVALGARGLG